MSERARIIPTLTAAKALSFGIRSIRMQVVLTSGSFDLLHLGHVRYLEAARGLGDYLIVGLDSDEKMRNRKGADRPYAIEEERIEFLSYQRNVDAIFVKRFHEPKYALIEAVQPNTLVATEGTYTADQIADITHRFGCVVKVLPRMYEGSSGQRVELLKAANYPMLKD